MKRTIRILNLNLKAYDKNISQKKRLQNVADFCNNNLVDVLLLQEGTYGLFGGNSIKTLSNMLNGGNYYYQEPTFGVWLMYQFQCGIISNFPIEYNSGLSCKIRSSSLIDRLWLPGSKRVIRVKTTVPEFGVINFITCHLDSNPVDEDNREHQHYCLKNYVNMVRFESDVVVVSGDFNARNDYVNDFLSPNFYNLINHNSDGIWATHNVRCIDRNIVFDSYTSDHFGQYVEIKKC